MGLFHQSHSFDFIQPAQPPVNVAKPPLIPGSGYIELSYMQGQCPLVALSSSPPSSLPAVSFSLSCETVLMMAVICEPCSKTSTPLLKPPRSSERQVVRKVLAGWNSTDSRLQYNMSLEISSRDPAQMLNGLLSRS